MDSLKLLDLQHFNQNVNLCAQCYKTLHERAMQIELIIYKENTAPKIKKIHESQQDPSYRLKTNITFDDQRTNCEC